MRKSLQSYKPDLLYGCRFERMPSTTGYLGYPPYSTRPPGRHCTRLTHATPARDSRTCDTGTADTQLPGSCWRSEGAFWNLRVVNIRYIF